MDLSFLRDERRSSQVTSAVLAPVLAVHIREVSQDMMLLRWANIRFDGPRSQPVSGGARRRRGLLPRLLPVQAQITPLVSRSLATAPIFLFPTAATGCVQGHGCNGSNTVIGWPSIKAESSPSGPFSRVASDESRGRATQGYMLSHWFKRDRVNSHWNLQ